MRSPLHALISPSMEELWRPVHMILMLRYGKIQVLDVFTNWSIIQQLLLLPVLLWIQKTWLAQVDIVIGICDIGISIKDKW